MSESRVRSPESRLPIRFRLVTPTATRTIEVPAERGDEAPSFLPDWPFAALRGATIHIPPRQPTGRSVRASQIIIGPWEKETEAGA